MTDQTNNIWLNGEYIAADQASVSIKDRGLLLGDGIFDTLAVKDNLIISPDLHFTRLIDNCAIIGIDPVLTKERWLEILHELISKNGLENGYASLRTTITRGCGMRGLLPPENPSYTIMISGQSYDPASFPKDVKLIICSKTRRNEYSPLSKIKSLNYADNIMAAMEAADKDANDAIMLNTKGLVTCASAGNIFIYDGAQYITPPINDGVLTGTTRAKIIDDYNVIERSITPEELFTAQAVILTNSIRGIQNVTHINDRILQSTKNHPVLMTG